MERALFTEYARRYKDTIFRVALNALGSPVAGGTATIADSDAVYGNYVVIEHDNGWSTLYAHCDAIAIKDGAHVEAGEKIATVGSSGQSSGPHLHFELKDRDGTPVDPEPYLAK